MPDHPSTASSSSLICTMSSYPLFIAISALFAAPSSVHRASTAPSTIIRPDAAVSTPTWREWLCAPRPSGRRCALGCKPPCGTTAGSSWFVSDSSRRYADSLRGVSAASWPVGQLSSSVCGVSAPVVPCGCGWDAGMVRSRSTVVVGSLGDRENVVRCSSRCP